MIDVSQIQANLFVGTCPKNTQDIDRLREDFGITAVLNVQTAEDMAYWEIDWGSLESRYREVGVEVWRVPVRDFSPEDLRRNLPRCVEVLDELLRQGHTVYVHCNMAVNRSPSVVIAYLDWIAGWGLEKALNHVTQCRRCDPYVEAIRLASKDRQRKE